MYNNNKNKKILESLTTKKEKTEFMIGGRVTVCRLTQLKDEEKKELVHVYHPKIRGLLVGREHFPTRDEAAATGQDIMRHWKEELERINANIVRKLANKSQSILKKVFAGG